MIQKGMLSWIEAMFEHFQIEKAHDNDHSVETQGFLTSVQTEFSKMLADIVINLSQEVS